MSLCYLLRHGTSTAMLDNDADMRYVQEILGHADVFTMQIYTHVYSLNYKIKESGRYSARLLKFNASLISQR